MLKEVIVKCIRDFLQQDMPHTLLPQMAYARIVKGGRKKVDLRILDNMNQVDENYNELPGISTEYPYEKGDIVLVSFAQGELENPTIIRKIDHLPQVRFARVTKSGISSINLRLLDMDQQVDENYDEITDVRNDLALKLGDLVIVGFLHCELKKPIVIRKWEDEGY